MEKIEKSECAQGTEQSIKDALRVHCGGLGPSLSEEDKEIIINGLQNQAENTKPVDGPKFLAGVEIALNNHPVSWLLK